MCYVYACSCRDYFKHGAVLTVKGGFVLLDIIYIKISFCKMCVVHVCKIQFT